MCWEKESHCFGSPLTAFLVTSKHFKHNFCFRLSKCWQWEKHIVLIERRRSTLRISEYNNCFLKNWRLQPMASQCCYYLSISNHCLPERSWILPDNCYHNASQNQGRTGFLKMIFAVWYYKLTSVHGLSVKLNIVHLQLSFICTGAFVKLNLFSACIYTTVRVFKFDWLSAISRDLI